MPRKSLMLTFKSLSPIKTSLFTLLIRLRPSTFFSLFVLSSLLLSGCQLSYLIENSYHQVSLWAKAEPIEKALKNKDLQESYRNKLLLIQETLQFAEKDLSLKNTKNYRTFISLKRPYVVYAVNAAPKWEMRNYLWKFPLVGKVPYKGFFHPKKAKRETKKLQEKGLDVYLRGVSAYSMLGWFKDPVYSSMLKYKDHDLVNVILHETVHSNLFIRNSAEFNEQLATFIGNKGMELFYIKKQGKDSPLLVQIKKEKEDQKLFYSFIGEEIKLLKKWYQQIHPLPQDKKKIQELLVLREEKFNAIKEKFKKEILPQLKTKDYMAFPKRKLNNARLLLFSTYYDSLSEFEKLYELSDRSFSKFLHHCKSLKGTKDIKKSFLDLLQKLQNRPPPPLSTSQKEEKTRISK